MSLAGKLALCLGRLTRLVEHDLAFMVAIERLTVFSRRIYGSRTPGRARNAVTRYTRIRPYPACRADGGVRSPQACCQLRWDAHRARIAKQLPSARGFGSLGHCLCAGRSKAERSIHYSCLLDAGKRYVRAIRGPSRGRLCNVGLIVARQFSCFGRDLGDGWLLFAGGS